MNFKVGYNKPLREWNCVVGFVCESQCLNGFCLFVANCLIFVWDHSGIRQFSNSNGNGDFRCLLSTVYGGAIQSKSKSTTVRLWGFPTFFFLRLFLVYILLLQLSSLSLSPIFDFFFFFFKFILYIILLIVFSVVIEHF